MPDKIQPHEKLFMSNYHRLLMNGGTYFFTVVTYNRQPLLCDKQAITRLKAAFKYAVQTHPYRLDALVVLPDHLHCIWTLPENDADFPTRWNRLKRYFSIGVEGKVNHRREKHIWQHRFWEHLNLGFTSLRSILSSCFNKIPEFRQKNKVDYSIHDILMSGFACMHFQDPSLLQFQKRLEKKHHKSNLQTLFDIKSIPESTQLRTITDEVDSDCFSLFFDQYTYHIQRGKHLAQYQLLDGLYYIPMMRLNIFHHMLAHVIVA